ncbi:MAG: hypothetical protein AVDCRST_MAG49-3796, partial [uncultured Thermomicrobiales bacterium]
CIARPRPPSTPDISTSMSEGAPLIARPRGRCRRRVGADRRRPGPR